MKEELVHQAILLTKLAKMLPFKLLASQTHLQLELWTYQRVSRFCSAPPSVIIIIFLLWMTVHAVVVSNHRGENAVFERGCYKEKKRGGLHAPICDLDSLSLCLSLLSIYLSLPSSPSPPPHVGQRSSTPTKLWCCWCFFFFYRRTHRHELKPPQLLYYQSQFRCMLNGPPLRYHTFENSTAIHDVRDLYAPLCFFCTTVFSFYWIEIYSERSRGVNRGGER